VCVCSDTKIQPMRQHFKLKTTKYSILLQYCAY